MDQEVPPHAPCVEAASIRAAWLGHSRDAPGITLRGPTRPSQGWQPQGAGA